MVDVGTEVTEHESSLLIQAERMAARLHHRPATAIAPARGLADDCRAAGDLLAECVVRAELAWAMREIYDHTAAQDEIARAVQCAWRIEAGPQAARALVVRAMIRLELGEVQAARDDLRLATDAAPMSAAVRFGVAVLAGQSGDLSLTESLLREVLDDPGCDDLLATKVLNNLADLLTAARPRQALELLDRAARLAEGSSAHLAAIIEHNRGVALARDGQIAAALASFDLARGRLREVDGPVVEHALEVAGVLGRLRLVPEARAALQEALLQLQSTGGALLRADALLSAGRLAADDADAAAVDLLGRAAQLYADQDRPYGRARALVALAEVGGPTAPTAADLVAAADRLEELGHHTEAGQARLLAADRLPHAASALLAQVAQSLEADPVTVTQARARLALAVDDPAGAQAQVDHALDLVDGRCRLAPFPELRHRMSAVRSRFEQLSRSAGVADDPATQLDVVLRRRPAPMVAEMEASGIDPDRSRWRQLSHRLATADDDPQTLATLRREFAEVEARLRSHAWGAVAADGPARQAPMSAAELSTHLGRDLVAVIRVGDSAVGYRSDGRRVLRADLGAWSTMLELTDQIRRGLARIASSAGPTRHRAFAVSRDLMAQWDVRLSPVLSGTDDLAIVVDRGLEGAPWAGLRGLWTRAHTVSSLPATVPRPATAATRVNRVLVGVGPGLRHAEAEAEGVAGVWSGVGRSPVVTGTAGQLRALIASADIVHLAAHAMLRRDNPLQSPVSLHDGPLALGELIEMGAAPRLVYLSCCSLADQERDPVLVGAVPLLLQSGVGRVVASTMEIHDLHALELAMAVHRALRDGAEPDEGLARLRRDTDPGDPQQAGRWAALGGTGSFTGLP